MIRRRCWSWLRFRNSLLEVASQTRSSSNWTVRMTTAVLTRGGCPDAWLTELQAPSCGSMSVMLCRPQNRGGNDCCLDPDGPIYERFCPQRFAAFEHVIDRACVPVWFTFLPRTAVQRRLGRTWTSGLGDRHVAYREPRILCGQSSDGTSCRDRAARFDRNGTRNRDSVVDDARHATRIQDGAGAF